MKHAFLLIVMLAACLGPVHAADVPPKPAAVSATPPPDSPTPAATSAAPETTKPAAPTVIAASKHVRVVTNMGSFTIELNAERAPLTVGHFLRYLDQGQYTNTLFHRVVPNFVVQGGGFDANYKIKPITTRVPNESGNGLSNLRGTVGMARGNDPHGADCQFFINLYDNAALDPNTSRWGYAVFGKVTEGMEVVDKIANVSTGAHGPIKEDTPLKPVVIEKIERLPN